MAFVIHYLKNDILSSIFNDDCLRFLNKSHLEKSMHKVGLEKDNIKKFTDRIVIYQGFINDIFVKLRFLKPTNSRDYILATKYFGYYHESTNDENDDEHNITLHSFNDTPAEINYRKSNITSFHYAKDGLLYRENGKPASVYIDDYAYSKSDNKISLIFRSKNTPLCLDTIIFDGKKNEYVINKTLFSLNGESLSIEKISDVIDRFKSITYSELVSEDELVTEDELNLLSMYIL